MSKRAVVVGVNDYSAQASLPPGWSVGNLGCCVADAQSMQTLLQSAFLFNQVQVLTDGAATHDAIIQAIQDMLTASAPGDVACFVYSGHGGRFPADPANTGRYYEAIIPASGNPITDLDIYNLASQLDQSVVNFTLILDSCYSGGIHEDTPDSTIRSAGYSSDYVQTCVSDMGTVIPCGWRFRRTVPPWTGSQPGRGTGERRGVQRRRQQEPRPAVEDHGDRGLSLRRNRDGAGRARGADAGIARQHQPEQPERRLPAAHRPAAR